MRSAPLFQLVRIPSSVFDAMMSSEDSTMAASRSLIACALSWSVTSRPTLEAPMISPSEFRIGEMVSATSMIVPSLRRRLVR